MAFTQMAIKFADGERWDIVAEDSVAATMIADFLAAVGPTVKESYAAVGLGYLPGSLVPAGTFAVDWTGVQAVLAKVWVAP
jgi:hypothetical protein